MLNIKTEAKFSLLHKYFNFFNIKEKEKVVDKELKWNIFLHESAP